MIYKERVYFKSFKIIDSKFNRYLNKIAKISEGDFEPFLINFVKFIAFN